MQPWRDSGGGLGSGSAADAVGAAGRRGCGAGLADSQLWAAGRGRQLGRGLRLVPCSFPFQLRTLERPDRFVEHPNTQSAAQKCARNSFPNGGRLTSHRQLYEYSQQMDCVVLFCFSFLEKFVATL